VRTARHCTRGGLNFIIESHDIALKIRSTVKEPFVHAIIGNSRRQFMPSLASQRLAYKSAVDPLKLPERIDSQVSKG
jgi:heat shock protein HspQ